MAPSTGGSVRSRPSSIILRAPAISSLGWKTSRTVPEKQSFREERIFAAVSRIAMWASWPQACIIPRFREAKGSPVCSSRGRASMSARRRRVFPPPVPRIRAVTPVSATFSRTSRPRSRRNAAILPAVRSSPKPGSGWAWNSLLRATSSPASSSVSWPRFAMEIPQRVRIFLGKEQKGSHPVSVTRKGSLFSKPKSSSQIPGMRWMVIPGFSTVLSPGRRLRVCSPQSGT